jgi:hypothetical protein
MNDLYECEPEGSTMRYSVIAKDETDALHKLRMAVGLAKEVGIKIKRKEYLGWIIF